jgi:hypothetical protein
MSLSDRLNTAPKRRPNRGCETCHWYSELPDADKGAFDGWLSNGWSLRQLHTICSTDPDHPLTISMTALKNHVHDCLGSDK